jgi:nucleotide-binding universal stress UspA family protein
MARDHNLPDLLGIVHSVKRTPHGAIIASGVMIAAMAVALPIEDVASAADIMFLLLFLLVNITVIKLRRNRPDLDRTFLVPLFPYIPIVAIVAQLFLAVYMFKMSRIAWYTVAGWTTFGIAFYYLYSSRKETEHVKTPIVFEEKELAPKDYHVLVPISRRNEVAPLMTVASAIARARDGDISALGVVEVPEQLPIAEGRRFIESKRQILDLADEFGEERDVPVNVKVRVTHRPANAILDTINEEKSDLVVMGWRGHTLAKDKLLGRTLDPLTRKAPCDIAVVKLREIEKIESIFVPTSGGPHAGFALSLAAAIARDTGARLVTGIVVPPDSDEEGDAKALEWVEATVSKLAPEEMVDMERKLIRSASIVDALIEESGRHSLTLIGASNQGVWEQLRLGSDCEMVSRRSSRSVVIVRKYEGPIKSWVRRFFAG